MLELRFKGEASVDDGSEIGERESVLKETFVLRGKGKWCEVYALVQLPFNDKQERLLQTTLDKNLLKYECNLIPPMI